MTKKTTKKTAKQSPYKFKKGDKVLVVTDTLHFYKDERITVMTDSFAPLCRTKEGKKYHVGQDKLRLVPKTVLTIKTSKGCAKIIKTDEKQFHVQSKSGNNEIVQHSELLVDKRNAIENILATFEIYNSAEMRAWAKEVKRKMKK